LRPAGTLWLAMQSDAPGPNRDAIAGATDAIETEMRRVGLWDVAQITDAQRESGGAFGRGSMTFGQWLRWIFLPRVRALLASGEALPAHSAVGAQAAREWGFSPIGVDTSRLETLLSDFDALFD